MEEPPSLYSSLSPNGPHSFHEENLNKQKPNIPPFQKFSDLEIASMNSASMNPELIAYKRKNEREAYIYGILAQFCWSLQSIQLKADIVCFQDSFTLNNLCFWRSVIIIAISYFMMKKNNTQKHDLSKLQYKMWFYIRSGGFYFMILLWLLMNVYFRISTCQCIVNCSPVIVLIISVFLLREKFYFRYISGLVICFLGTFLIISNEAKTASSDEKKKIIEGAYSNPIYSNMFVGCLVAGTHLMITSFANFGQKMIAKDKIEGDEQNFYLGIMNAIPSFIVMMIQMKIGLNNIWYILFAMSHGPVFYCANYFSAVALKKISINKFMPLTYLSIVFVFIFGFVFFGEKVYLTDVIGSLLIMGFQLYNIYVPTTK